MTYNQYINEYGNDKTSVTLINLFFDKRDNAGIGQMSFLPVSSTIAIIYPPVGVGLVVISCPLFVFALGRSRFRGIFRCRVGLSLSRRRSRRWLACWKSPSRQNIEGKMMCRCPCFCLHLRKNKSYFEGMSSKCME